MGRGQEEQNESELGKVSIPTRHKLGRCDGEYACGNSGRRRSPQHSRDLRQESRGQSVRDQVGDQDDGDEKERRRRVEPNTEGQKEWIERGIGGGGSGLHRAERIADGAFVDEGPRFHHHFVAGTQAEALGMKVLVGSERKTGGEECEETLVLHAWRLSFDASTAADGGDEREKFSHTLETCRRLALSIASLLSLQSAVGNRVFEVCVSQFAVCWNFLPHVLIAKTF